MTEVTQDNLSFDDELCMLVPALQSNARRYCKSDADLQDLVQQTVEKALVYRTSYTPGTNMKAWLSTIMRNLYINKYRSIKRRYALMEKIEQEPERVQAVKPDHRDGFNDANTILETLKEGLSECYFETLKQCDYDDKSYREIAEDMEVPIGTVMSRLFRARRAARNLIIEHHTQEALDYVGE